MAFLRAYSIGPEEVEEGPSEGKERGREDEWDRSPLPLPPLLCGTSSLRAHSKKGAAFLRRRRRGGEGGGGSYFPQPPPP